MELVYKQSGLPVEPEDEVVLRGGEKVKVVGIQEPHKPSSTGRVYVVYDAGHTMAYYPSVIGAHWINREDQPWEKDNIVQSRSLR